MQNLLKEFREKIAKELKDQLKLGNIMAVPKLSKIVVNIGLKEALSDKKVLDIVAGQLAEITGQKPIVTRAKTSISAFKLRAGEKIGLKVTLRGARMYDFFEKLIKVVLPRVRDFQGVDRAGFDEKGNYNLGFNEQIVFPEIDYAKIDKVRGLQISIVTTAGSVKEGKFLMEKLGMPFTKEGSEKRGK